MSEPRVQFRPYVATDCEALPRLADNPRVSANLQDHFPSPYTMQDAREWVALNIKRDPPTSFAITVDGEFAGGIGIVLGSDVHRKCGEVGYWLGEPYWGRGIATLCVVQFSAWVFDQFDLIRLSAGVFESNPASARVLEKAGFELESRRRSAVIKAGRVMDELIYVKLRETLPRSARS